MVEDSISFKELAIRAKEIASTSSRLKKVEIVAKLITKIPRDEAYKALLILTGRIFPPSDPRELNVSWSTLMEVIEELGEVDWKGVDVGEVVERALAKRKRRQTTLVERPLTVKEVYSTLESLAEISGSGSKERRISILRSLFSRTEPVEAWLLANAIIRETRLGLNEGLLIDAIAKALGLKREDVERASMVMGSPYMILKEGIDMTPKVFRPLRPMLAQTADSVEEAIKEFGKAAVEYKLDGVRVQVHVSGDKVRVFSRRMSDVTNNVPEIVDAVRSLRLNKAILEGEIIAEKGGRPLPFQDLMRRFRRVNLTDQLMEEVPLKLYLFDLLYLDRSYLDEPYFKRRELLEGIVRPPVELVPRLVTESSEEAKNFMEEATDRGHEGVMVKRLGSPYVPGVRGRHWLKVKRVHTLDLVIVAAERGYGRRHRWYSDYYLAARSPETGEFLVVGKTFKGLTDREFEWMTKRLEELTLEKRGKFIRVKPEIVVEVAFNEIQRSPKYKSGLALRFARIVRIREDKSPDEADTIDRLREIYEGRN